MRSLVLLLSFLRVAFVGDPQVDDAVELDYARRSVYRELIQRSDLDLVVVLGDLVNDNPSLIAPSEAILDSLRCPWVRVHGNHDGVVAPRDTVFEMGGVRFVLLNDIPSAAPSERYTGPTVVCAHCPFKSVKDSSSNMLYVTAHLHQVFRKEMGAAGQVGAGASCGSWWRGVKDAEGIPYALMNCGAPRGYFVADFYPRRKQWYRLSYKCVGRPESEQASVRVVEGNASVNVYGGSPSGHLEVKCKGRPWIELSRTETIAPEVQDVIDYNLSCDRAWRKAHRDEFIPMRRIKSTHVWTGAIPGSSPVVAVRYHDRNMSFRQRVR